MSKKSYKNINLSKIQIDVTQICGTEKPFDNDYWDLKEDGIYVDVIDGEPLFCSIHKYDSGSGWPSFYQTIDKSKIKESSDLKLGYERTELKSKKIPFILSSLAAKSINLHISESPMFFENKF